MAAFFLEGYTSATFDQILTNMPCDFFAFHGQATTKTWLLQILQILIILNFFFELVVPSRYRKYLPECIASYSKFCAQLFTNKPISLVTSIAVVFWLVQDSTFSSINDAMCYST